MYSLRICLLALVATCQIGIAQSKERICPIRKCEHCLDPSLRSAPAIGFHLGLTSGAVAISFNDGHIENAVKIPGTPEYLALMQDFSSYPDRLDPPALDSPAERAHYLWMRMKRRMNLLLGRPGSPEAATLSSMLISLRDETVLHLSTSVATVGIVLPNAALASREEVNDALNYAKLKPLDKWQLPDGELNAAYGAYGFGLCPSYHDPYKCEDEEGDIFASADSVLHLDFTSRTLAANTALISSARSTYATTKFANWELGRDATAQWDTDDEYWNAVGSAIRDVATNPNQRAINRLLLTGERANDETFLEVVRDSLRGSGVAEREANMDQMQMNFTFVPARGVAEFQRRRQRGWLGCVQPKHCPEVSDGEAEKVLEL